MSQPYSQPHQPNQGAYPQHPSFPEPQHRTQPGSAPHPGVQYGALPPTYNQAFGGNSSAPGDSSENEDDNFKYGVSAAQCKIEVRMAFVRKVYMILATQLGGTVLVGCLFSFNDQAHSWGLTNQWASFVSLFGAIGVMLALFWKRHSSPLNLYLLRAFTLLEAYSVGTIVTFYFLVDALQISIIIFTLFIGLTPFTMHKFDFRGMGSILNIVVWLVAFASFIHISL